METQTTLLASNFFWLSCHVKLINRNLSPPADRSGEKERQVTRRTTISEPCGDSYCLLVLVWSVSLYWSQRVCKKPLRQPPIVNKDISIKLTTHQTANSMWGTFMTLSCWTLSFPHKKTPKHMMVGDDVNLQLNSKSNTFDNPSIRLVNEQGRRPMINHGKWNTRMPSMNSSRPSGGDEQVPLSPPWPVDWDQWRQRSVRCNWCGHQVEDPLTARLAWAPFDCWCTPIHCHASARQFYFSSLLKVFSSD